MPSRRNGGGEKEKKEKRRGILRRTGRLAITSTSCGVLRSLSRERKKDLDGGRFFLSAGGKKKRKGGGRGRIRSCRAAR